MSFRPNFQSKAQVLRFERLWRYIFLLSGFLLVTTILIVAAPRGAHAGNSCCLASEFTIVMEKGIESTSHRTAWINRLKQSAKSAYDNGDYYLAKRLWEALATEGHADSAFKLGMLYDTGDYIPYDPVKAAYWYLKAAEKGHKHAQHNIAVAYANGEGVELDIAQAMKWWRLAAYQGNSDSQYNLGIIYAMGAHGIQKNIEKAKLWWRKAAISGDALAQYNLGTLYANGEGNVRSYCEAARWWEKSASAGVKQASWALEVIKLHRDYNACW